MAVGAGEENDAVIQRLDAGERRSVRAVPDVGVVKKQVAAREPLREPVEIINVAHPPASVLLLSDILVDLVKAS